jgi:hypothetical protein
VSSGGFRNRGGCCKASAFVLASFAIGLAARPADADPSAPASSPPDVHQAPQPDSGLTYREVAPYPTLAWTALQLLPSPELAFGRQRNIDESGAVHRSVPTTFGLRWQLTPVLWSFGVHRRQPRWRFFVVDPIARQSGSLELSTSFEYIGGEIDSILVRPGLRLYLPVVQRGEYLSVSLGTSAYRYEGLRVAYDVGAYILSGFLGLQVTVAPTHAPLAAIATVRFRYF